MGTTEARPLKVLNPTLATRLRDFNQAARKLQEMGVRLQKIEPTDNRLQISSADGERLLSKHLVEGYQRHPTAGSTRFTVLFEGVILEWRTQISYLDLQTVH